MKDCIFCKIVSGELTSKKVFEDEEILAFHDISPKAPVHVLVIPKKHIAKLSEANSENQDLLGKLQLTAAKIAKDLGVGNAFRLSTLSGEDAGQTVFHLHYHIEGGWTEKMSEDK